MHPLPAQHPDQPVGHGLQFLGGRLGSPMSPKTVVSPPSGVPHPVVEATPPTRRVRLGGNGFEIRSFTLADRDNDRAPGRPWSDGEIALPDDVESSSVRILAAAAHEWSVDLVVQFKRREEYPVRTELWRTSPWRIRRRLSSPLAT